MASSSTKSGPPTVIITGAGAGLGRACAFRFGQAGARLGLVCRDRAALESLARELEIVGAEAIAIAPADVADADAVEQAAATLEAALGVPDIWINDAMVTVFSPVHDISPAEFRRVTEVTYLGVVHGCMAALKRMRPAGQGHIINIGSALAYRGIPLQSAYCGAKHAIRGFTAALRSELSHERSPLKVSIIEMPAMNTPQFDWARTHMARRPKPMGTIYEPEAAAEAVFRAARTRPREYWVGLSTAMTIIGNTVLPDFMDWYLGRNAVEGQQTASAIDADRQDNLFDPVHKYHRTRGNFRAQPHAMTVSGAWARMGVVSGGALLFLGAGAALAAWMRGPRG